MFASLTFKRRSILVKVLLRDGIIYYLCIGTLHAINLVLFVVCQTPLTLLHSLNVIIITTAGTT